MSCGVGSRCHSDLVWLWLWRRLEATALIHPLVWEPPHAVGEALKKKKKEKEKENNAGLCVFIIQSGPGDQAENAVCFGPGAVGALGVWGGRGTERQIAAANVGRGHPDMCTHGNENETV